jgi:ketosteroid isomerase-like protein
MRAVVVLLSVSLLTLVSSSPSAQSGDVRAAIEAANLKFGAAWGKKDAAALTALYTANATVLAPNAARVTGSQAIVEFWKAGLNGAPPVGKLTTVEVEAHGDTAHEVGTYELSTADGKIIDKGKYVVIWKREGGQWKMHRDIWNSDMPAAAAM